MCVCVCVCVYFKVLSRADGILFSGQRYRMSVSGRVTAPKLSAPNPWKLWVSLVAQWQRLCLQCWRCRFNPQVTKIPWRTAWQHTPVFLSGESHGQRSLVG